MKNKGLVIIGLIAALSAGASMTSMAAAGWAMENGKWVYYDSYGYRITDDWKKGADDQWRYLNSYGEMAVDCWVDEDYYVDSNGIMVAGKWLQLDCNESGETGELNWYYFSTNGKAVKEAWKKIDDKWYHFDEDGAMETGWLDDNMYYAGESGAALVGWQLLEPPEDEEEDLDPFENDGRLWYYFNSSGKKFVPTLTDGAEYGEKRIDGTYYCFNENGAMQTGWVYIGGSVAESGTIAEFRFYDQNGKSVSGWYTAEPPQELSGYENDIEWFYFSKNGEPKCGPEEGEASVKDLFRINNKTYLFNELGTPVWGIQKVYASTNSDDYTAYYFDPTTRTVQKGKMTIEEGDGSKSQYYFSDSGKGYTGVQNGYLYYRGKLQVAEDNKYEVYSIPSGSGHINYLVNTSGKVVKSSSGVKDGDGTKYTTSTTGVLTKINGESVSSDTYFKEPIEPIWQ